MKLKEKNHVDNEKYLNDKSCSVPRLVSATS